MDINSIIWILIGIVLVLEALMEWIKRGDPEKKLKTWYSSFAMAMAFGLSGLCRLAALFHGTWALIFVVGLLAYAMQHFFADAIIKRIKRAISEARA